MVSCTALPPAVTLMTDTTLSVGLPSLSASTQVPASFFNRSRPERAAAVAFWGAGLSPPRAPAPRAISIKPPTRNCRRMSFSRVLWRKAIPPHQGEGVYFCSISARDTRALHCGMLVGHETFRLVTDGARYGQTALGVAVRQVPAGPSPRNH